MCGIVGIISKTPNGFYHSDLDLFEELLVCDSVRGLDSTGVFGIHKNKQAKTLKVAAEPHSLFRCEEWGDFRTKAVSSMTALVGHNRSATRGAVNSANAHPFTEGNIILVHNGTLHNHKDFNKDVEVDSHAITHAFNERPAKEVLKEINGAFTFVWYDRRVGRLFIARNNERPLAYVETSSNIIFASEGPMLDWILGRKTGTYEKAKSFPVGELISFDSKGAKESESFEMYRPKPVGNTVTHITSAYGQQTRLPLVTTMKMESTPSSDSRIPAGTKVLVRIDEVIQTSIQNNTVRLKGSMLYPQSKIDITGFMDRSLPLDSAYKMMRTQYVEGTVQSYHSSNCGPSYYLNNITFPEMIRVHNTSLPMAMWQNIAANHKCDKCGGKINVYQPDFTSVKVRSSNNKLRVVCADCVSEAFSEATEKQQAAIIESSSNNVPKRLKVSKSPENRPDNSYQQACAYH